MKTIDYYFAVYSPFCYLAGDRLEQIAQKHGAKIDYHPVNILTIGEATGWTPPAKRHPARLEYRTQELTRIAAHYGLPINLKPAHWPPKDPSDLRIPSTALNAAIISGADVGKPVQAIMRALWVEDQDISKLPVVHETLVANGMIHDEIAPHFKAGEKRYNEDTEAAPDRGVFGVPFYIVDDQKFWGQDRLDYLDRYLAGEK